MGWDFSGALRRSNAAGPIIRTERGKLNLITKGSTMVKRLPLASMFLAALSFGLGLAGFPGLDTAPGTGGDLWAKTSDQTGEREVFIGGGLSDEQLITFTA